MENIGSMLHSQRLSELIQILALTSIYLRSILKLFFHLRLDFSKYFLFVTLPVEVLNALLTFSVLPTRLA